MIRVAKIKQHEKGFVDMTEKNNACVTCPLYKQRCSCGQFELCIYAGFSSKSIWITTILVPI